MTIRNTWSEGVIEPRGDGDQRPSLLIADDDAVVRSTLHAQLGGEFYVVGLAETAAEAIELAETHRPDAALLDVEMPDGGARGVVPQIAKRSPATCMVMLSGDECDQSVVNLIEAGAIAYIRKGVTRAKVAETLAAAIKVKAASTADLATETSNEPGPAHLQT
jgi:DNA-binding NarL/FixJ family response regulator